MGEEEVQLHFTPRPLYRLYCLDTRLAETQNFMDSVEKTIIPCLYRK
jgi:hypothetical protein